MIQKIKQVFSFLFCVLWVIQITACGTAPSDKSFSPVNIEVQGEGIVIVRESDLERMGTTFPENGDLKVKRLGVEIPAWKLELQGAGVERSIAFYHSPSHSRYTTVDTYQLVSSPESMPTLLPMPPGFGAAATAVQTWIRLEEDNIYEPLSTSETKYLWETLTDQKPFQISFSLEGLKEESPTSLRMSVRKRGAIDRHAIEVQLNGLKIEEYSWQGSPEAEINIMIPPTAFAEEDNLIEISLTGDDAEKMVVDVDWLEVYYYQETIPGSSFLKWQTEKTSQNIGGWQGLTITLPVTEGEGWISQAGPTGVVSYPTTPGSVYVTADESGWKYPRLLRPIHTTDSLERGFSGADYIIIAPPIWQEDLEPLADYYRTQGLKTTIAALDAIYDRYTNGQVDPSAIQTYIQEAWRKWEIKPKYALLVGDFTNDPTKLPDNGAYLPSFFVNSKFGGETISDFPFSLDESGQSTIAIGRWPVNNRNDLQRILGNSLSQAESPPEELRIFGLVDPAEESFNQTYEIMRRLFEADQPISPEIAIERFEPQKLPESEFGFLVYFGHGSLTSWGSPPLLNTSIIKDEWRGVPLAVMQFTCLTSYFIAPDEVSLSEELLLAGVPIVYGPTHLTLPGDQWALVESWVMGLKEKNYERIGDLIVYTWNNLPATNEANEIRQTYILLGDPAYRIP